MKKLIHKLHLYLGLTTGLIIMITCLTGAILVFEKELQVMMSPQRYYVEKGDKKVPLESMIDNLKKSKPDAKISGVKIPSDPEKTISVTYNGRTEAFFNPYTGQLIETYAYRDTFFYQVFALHRWLLAGDTGKMIVGVSTVVFLFILISGIIMWWKPNKKFIQQQLKIKPGAGWKRFNYDSHVVIGFYSSIFLFIFAFTGLAWSFQWFNNGIYFVTRSENKKIEAPESRTENAGLPVNFDTIFAQAGKTIPDAQIYIINTPKTPTGSFQVSTLTKNSLHESAYDYHYFDQYTGALISSLAFSERNLGQKVRSSFKPVHIGSIFGMPSKIIGFLACLAGTFFPISGTIIWLNKKRKRKSRVKVVSQELVNK